MILLMQDPKRRTPYDILFMAMYIRASLLKAGADNHSAFPVFILPAIIAYCQPSAGLPEPTRFNHKEENRYMPL